MNKCLFLTCAVFVASCCAFGAYVTDGLVLRYDAIDNAGVGTHSDSPAVWKDLSGNGHDLTFPASGLTVGADTITFDHVSGSVSGISCLTDATGTPELTLEVVAAADETFDATLNSARMLAANPRVSLYFRQVGAQHVVGGIYHDGTKRQFAGAPVRRCDWNSKQFICRFHTYSLRTKSNGGSVAVDGSEYATLQSSFYNAATDLTDVFNVGSGSALYKIKAVRLYSRQLTVAEAAQNAAEDEARFSIKPAVDANGNANAFDDAAFYFRSARQALNAYLDNYEFANALYVGSAKDPAGDTFSVGGERKNIKVETMDVPAPYAGKTLRNRSVIHFAQPLNSDTTKASTSNIILSQPVAATNKASYTVMLRFKVESRVNPDASATGMITLLELGYGYSAPSGVALQLYGPGDNLWVRAIHGNISDDFKDMQNDSTMALKIGEWVDMALTVNGRANYLYYKTESGSWYEGYQNTDVGLTSATWGLYKLTLGGPTAGTGIGTSADASSTSAFRGWYQQVAVWDRALSRDEVLNAFRDGCADGDEWKVGVANDMSLEFAGRGAANIGTVNDWQGMTNELKTVGSSATVNFDLAADSYAKMRTFKFKTTSVSADGAFNLAVNGMTVAENVAATAGQSAAVTVPGGFFASGANTLTVTRTDSNAGKMEIDCLSLVVAEGNIPAATSAPAGDPLAGAYRWFREGGTAFRDVLRTAYPNSSAHNWTMRGPSDNIVHDTVSVTCPYRGVTLTDEKCIYFKQETYTNENGVIYGKGGCMYSSIFPVSNAVAHTSFIRFKIDSFQNPTNCSAQIYGTGYDWTNGRGMALFLNGSNPENLRIGLGLGKATLSINSTQSGEMRNRLAQGKWIDFAVVVSNGFAHVYACVEGGDFMDLGKHDGRGGGLGDPSTWSGMYFGTYSGASSASWASNLNLDYFRGWVHQAAVWPYALSEKDVKAVFGFPSPEIARIGVENGSSAEFYGSSAASYTYPANADFRDAPSVIPAGGNLTLTFNLAAGDVRSQLLKIASTDASAAATFAVSVNGRRITNFTEQYAPITEFAVAPGGSVVVGVLSRYLHAGANTVTITRIDSDTGAFEIDALLFGNGDNVRVRGSGYSLSFR